MAKPKTSSNKKNTPRKSAPRRSFDALWNFLTVVLLMVTLCLGLYFVSIYILPTSSLNLFPPPTPITIIAMPTITATSINQMPPTWTPAPLVVSQSSTQKPTITQLPTDTPIVLPSATSTSTFTPVPTATSTKATGYIAQSGSPFYVTADSKGGDRGCAWLGVAGQVFNAKGAPVQGLTLLLGGTLQGKTKHLRTLSGSATLYGPGGYEFQLREDPIKSKGTLFVQVYDQYGNAVSPEIYFWTYDDCDKNLILINFIKE